MEGICSTNYPVLLLHGLAYRDGMRSAESWGRIPDRLEAAGCTLYLDNMEAWNPIDENAGKLCEVVAAILADTGADKVNIIGHSKGGLEARYALSRLGLSERVASLTTINTPHHGTYMADVACAAQPSQSMLQGVALDIFARLMGDDSPQNFNYLWELTLASMVRFNLMVPDSPRVYYQSFGTIMKRVEDEPMFTLSFGILKLHDGDNDGMVPTRSCRWTNFRGILPTAIAGEGISHLEITDFRKTDVAGVDIPSIYVGIVRGLKDRGF